MRWMPLCLAGALCLAGCGTMAHGTLQTVPIDSTPAGATVMVDGEHLGTTPLAATLERGRDHSVRLEMRDRRPVEFTLRRTVQRWVWGDVLTVVGLVVDWANGGLFVLRPERVEAFLPPENDEMAGGPGPVARPIPVALRAGG